MVTQLWVLDIKDQKKGLEADSGGLEQCVCIWCVLLKPGP